MKLVIGGAYQGKLSYAKRLYPGIKWVDGAACAQNEAFQCEGIYHFQEYIRRMMRDGKTVEMLAEELREKNPDLVVVSDEIGCGLVPVDRFEREYREQTGRILTELAAFADRVDRVMCGIGTVIKAEDKSGEYKKEEYDIEERNENTENLPRLERVLPREIEQRSFEIITEELGDTALLPGTEPIVKRCIHTSADFDYAKNLVFSEDVVKKALDAIRNGASIVTDTQMGRAGINKQRLKKYGGEVYCFMADEDVAEIAKKNGTTRATASMDKAAELDQKLIFAVGNAPTALVRLYELITSGKIRPELVIAVPVGFVNVVQSKEMILSLPDTPYIVARGRKGGSNIAACICNALLYMLDDEA